MANPVPVEFRQDVAAVGPITPDDVFIIASVVNPNSKYFPKNNTLDGYTFAPLCLLKNSNNTPNSLIFNESTWGSVLTTGNMPSYPNPDLTLHMLYFRFNRLPFEAPPDRDTTVNYNDYVFSFDYIPYTDPSGSSDTVLNDEGLNYHLAWDSRHHLNISKTLSTGMMTTSKAPTNSPDFPNLQAGIRYTLDTSNVGTVTSTHSATAVTDINSPYLGLPNTIAPATWSTSVADIDIVFLPISWLTDKCTVPITVTSQLANSYLHFCDRWGKLKGKNTPFYQQSCGAIDNQRGNVNAATCQITEGVMYYPSTNGTNCGSQWSTGTIYQDMTDTLVHARNSYGVCGDGFCGFNSETNRLSCFQSTDDAGGNCVVNCEGCKEDSCSGCGPSYCDSVKPDCSQCGDLNNQCNLCNKTIISIWAWIIIIALVLIIFGLLFWLLYKNKQPDTAYPSNYAPTGYTFVPIS